MRSKAAPANAVISTGVAAPGQPRDLFADTTIPDVAICPCQVVPMAVPRGDNGLGWVRAIPASEPQPRLECEKKNQQPERCLAALPVAVHFAP